MSSMSFMVSFNIVSNTFNLQPLGASYCSEKKKIMHNLAPWMFLVCFFDTFVIAYYLVFLIDIFFFLLFLSFIILGIVRMCYHCWPKLGHSWTKTLH
jgi:hypothetical protein